MLSLNYRYLEKLISESQMNQKDLASEIGLPEKFFTRLNHDGSNLSVGDLCLIADYFQVGIEDLMTSCSEQEFSNKVNRGRILFSRYFEYRDKYKSMVPPEADAYKSAWVSDVKVKTFYNYSPQQAYVESDNNFHKIKGIYLAMENVLMGVVCSLEYTLIEKKKLRDEIIMYFVYGIAACSPAINRRLIIALANRAAAKLIDEIEYKKLM